MIRSLCAFFLGNNDGCIVQRSKAKQDADTIQALKSQVVSLLGQIQELKAVNDYQAFQLEQKISALEKENSSIKSSKSCKSVKDEKATTHKALDGSTVKIVDNAKKDQN